MDTDELPLVFVTHAVEILGDTELGLSGSQIVKLTSAYAIDAGINIPHRSYPFIKQEINKRRALAENIAAFSSAWRYKIIRQLCDHKSVQQRNAVAANKLKVQLFLRFGHLSNEENQNDLNHALVVETRHWLSAFTQSLDWYAHAERKRSQGAFDRNMLDDLRLALETLLHELLGNRKSLENQILPLGVFIKKRDGSAELAGLLVKLIEYYAEHKNTGVKRDAAAMEQEIEFMFEVTSCFMRHLVRIFGRKAGSANNKTSRVKSTVSRW